MRKHFLLRRVSRSALHALAAAYAAAAPLPAGDEIAVIVNKANGAVLPPDQVRKVFMGDRGTWPNGKRITVLNRHRSAGAGDRFVPDLKMRDVDLNASGRSNLWECWLSQRTISWNSL